MSQTIKITKAQVESGDDSGVPAVTLHCGESVIYELDSDAAAIYHFRLLAPMTLTQGQGGLSLMQFVTGLVHRPHQLTVSLNQNAPAWKGGKATFYFAVDVGIRNVSNPPPFDPVIDSDGPKPPC